MDNRVFPHSSALRRGRVSQRDGVYLVTFRCAARRPLIADPNLAQLVADEIGQLDEKLVTKTYAFVLMPDHVHWLFQLCGVKSLSEVVGRLKGRSSREINRARNAPGPLWQQGFHDRALRQQESLRAVGFYVINNPVRAGLADKWCEYPMVYASEEIAAEAAPTGDADEGLMSKRRRNRG